MIIKMKFSKDEIVALIETIKNDSVLEFGALVSVSPEIFNLSFGRFPILSFVYLYSAKRIAKKYHEDFTKTTYHIESFEPEDTYQKFKNLAGVHLRKYQNAKVTPPEMLALTNQTGYLCSKFSDLRANKDACSNITSVYARNNREAHIEFGQIKVSAEPLDKKKKAIFFGLFAFIFVVAVLFSVLASVVFNRIGFGTENRPFFIYNEAQFLAAANTTDHFILQNDLVLENVFLQNFTARINGNGNTIYLSSNRYLISNFTGTFKDMNFVVSSYSPINIASEFAVITRYNGGLIENVSLDLSIELISNNPQDTLVGTFAVTNYRDIFNSTVSGQLNIIQQSYRHISVGALVAVNSHTGIGNSRRNAVISYSNSFIQISVDAPNTISNQTFATNIELGGFSALNSGNMLRNKFAGVLNVTHSEGVSYIGGIVATNSVVVAGPDWHIGAILRNNGSFGTIVAAPTSDNATAVVGGITSRADSGSITGNFSIARIYGNDYTIAAGILGLLAIRVFGFNFDTNTQLTEGNFTMSNFFVSSMPYAEFGLGFGIYRGTLFIIDDDQIFMQEQSYQQIRQNSIFWDRRVT